MKEKCSACLPYLNEILSRAKKEPLVTEVQLDMFDITKSMLTCRKIMECGADAVLATNENFNKDLQSRND